MRCVLLVFTFVLGCSSANPARPGGPDPRETPPTTSDPGAVMDTPALPPTPFTTPEDGTIVTERGKPDGSACLLATECSSGVCEGLGCANDQPGACAPKNPRCTRDLRPYCGCDGKTFRTSGSCPGRRYSAKAECTP